MGLYEREYYHDENVQPFRPWNARSMVTTLIIVNVAIFLANFIFGSGTKDPVNEWLWLRAADIGDPVNWYRLLTNGFAHSKGINHILFNMLTLYFLGQAVEMRYGRGEFLRIYLVSVVLCSLLWGLRQWFTTPAELLEHRALLGASGAVTTITMLFVFNFPQSTLNIWGILPVKAWAFGIFVVVINLLGNSSFTVGNTKNVAYDVHLVGAAFAAVYFYGQLSFGALGNLAATIKNKATGPKLKIHKPEEARPTKLQAEADRILDKIHREGQDSLTAKERKLLEEYSRAVRKNRQQ